MEGFGLRLKQLAVKCRKCQLVMWLPDCKAVGEESPLGLLSQKDRVEMPADPSETELLAFAATLGGYPEKETHVRLWAWWRRNDPIRRGQADVTGWTDERKQNLLSLEKLLDVTREEDHLAHAEIERELGNFDKSLKLLEGNWHEDNLPTVTALRKLAESKTPAVTKLSQIPDSLSSP